MASVLRCIINALLLLLIVSDLSSYRALGGHWDPYKVLGLDRDATQEQIKKAHRESARKLHPDKNASPNADKQFLEVQKAYSLLKDPESRSRFDRSGKTNQNGYEYRYPTSHTTFARENWRGYRSSMFSSTDKFDRNAINARQFYSLIKDSSTRVAYIFFYSDFCPTCHVIESAWFHITDELAKHGINSYTINIYQERRLAYDLGLEAVPRIACLINNKVHYYQQSELSLKQIVKFTASLLPKNIIRPLWTAEEQDRFVSQGQEENKITVVFYSQESNLKIRYSLLAFETSKYYRFGHITNKALEHKQFARRFNLSEPNNQMIHVVAFDENVQEPIISTQISLKDNSLSRLRIKLLDWPFLQLPRLSSQQHFDDLCLYAIPRKENQTRKKLCVILISRYISKDDHARAKIIEFTRMNNLQRNDKVVFSYMDPHKQDRFIKTILAERQSTGLPTHDDVEGLVLALERQPNDPRKAVHRILESRWTPSDVNELDRAKHELHTLIESYVHDVGVLDHKIVLNQLFDEHEMGLLQRVFWRLARNIMNPFSSVGDAWPIMGLLILCAILPHILRRIQKNSEPSSFQDSSNMNQNGINKQNVSVAPNLGYPATAGSHVRTGSAGDIIDELKILELKAETLNGMVRLLRPGCRSIILLCDQKSKDVLIEKFKQIVGPYRRNRTLLFGYLCLDKNLIWYQTLIRQVLDDEHICLNKKNCIGTVLSLNGFKRYFRVYHAKHNETKISEFESEDDGSFLGFDEDNIRVKDLEQPRLISDGTRCLCVTEQLLDRLPVWLDMMFDGLTKRYFVDEWPDDIR